ncbi:TIGR01459 family HAD-type hydrolase [Kiloniella sp. EL199]|uniref:TIGR01459 family HAD-type hydrolase n=1 Tax=Kiloniella sp. EL199 TaxID=2107581 RepID=UPI0020B1464B|nr:TIGR01459 family HAD-type hydrolase [Kiloniella sp. EL199]
MSRHLENLSISTRLYDHLQTSGDATARNIQARSKELNSSTYPLFFHVGPDRTQATLTACGGTAVPLEEAELIICTGLFNDEKDQLADYENLLLEAAKHEQLMICANPDRVVKRGDKTIICAGSLALRYEELGGKVSYIGKPYPDVFHQVINRFPTIPNSRTVMIGDSLHTDIEGAKI